MSCIHERTSAERKNDMERTERAGTKAFNRLHLFTLTPLHFIQTKTSSSRSSEETPKLSIQHYRLPTPYTDLLFTTYPLPFPVCIAVVKRWQRKHHAEKQRSLPNAVAAVKTVACEDRAAFCRGEERRASQNQSIEKNASQQKACPFSPYPATPRVSCSHYQTQRH